MSTTPSRRANPFRPGVVLGVLLVGALAFLLMLYALGQGWTGDGERNGGTHAASNGLNGFAGLVDLLEDTGHEVQLSRSRGTADDYGLLVLTPPLYSDGEEIAQMISERREYDYGPTLIILPKWAAYPISGQAQEQVEAEDGWVFLLDAGSPAWFSQTELGEGGELAVGGTNGWNGFGASGDLPDEERVQALVSQTNLPFRSLVVDSEADLLVGQLDVETAYSDYSPWPVIVVFEPDLMNNYGMAEPERAQLAMGIIASAMEGENMPIIFDMTLAGMGSSENLLTLAFSPPFLAATLCLILAAFVIAWRGFRRFGPPLAEAPAMQQGKRQLARNGASLVSRVKRFHLLADPYASLMGKRIADALGIRDLNPETRDRAIDRALERRGFEGPGYTQRAHDLRAATSPRDILRAAGALKSIERTLKR